MSNTTARSWLTSVNSGTYSSQYIPVLEEDVVYGTVVCLDIAKATTTTDNTKNFRVTIPMSNIKTALNEDTSIVEIKFALWSSATKTFDFNGTSGFKLTQNAWTECVLTREQALASNGNLSYGGLVTSSAQTVKISSIYLIKSGPIVNNIIEKISDLPTVDTLKFYDGSRINEVYAEYSALSTEYQSLVTNASVLTAIKQYYDSHYEAVYSEDTNWFTTVETGTWGAKATKTLICDQTYGTVVEYNVVAGTGTSANYAWDIKNLQSFVENDSTITEVRFMVYAPKTTSSNFYLRTSESYKYVKVEEGNWYEVVLEREWIMEDADGTIRMYWASLADVDRTVKISNFYAVKTVAE